MTSDQIQPPVQQPSLPSQPSWGRGYFTGLSSPSLCFRELAPNWIDFGLLIQKQRPPRRRDGDNFHYLELGSGMGMGLCLLAAAYPEGRFVGMDFKPDHVANSEWLVAELGLTNISFQEVDFVDLLDNSEAQSFDYVVAHGIISWVAEPVRSAVLRLAQMFLRPGGAFYCSYNTFPGWLERSIYKSMVDLEQHRLGPSKALEAFIKANQAIQRCLASRNALSALARSFPQLAGQLCTISEQSNTASLAAEFANDHWQPFYVGEVHRLAAHHKLTFVASATLPENHPGLLPPELAAVVTEETDPLLRQARLDLVINQGFRRDLFVKGVLPLSRTAQQQMLAELSLRLTMAPAPTPQDCGDRSRIDTTLGLMIDDSGKCQQVETLLSQQPASLGTIQQTLGIPPDELLTLISLLLHANHIGLDRGAASAAATASCRAVNHRLIELMQSGNNLGFLAAPAIGHGAEPFSVLDAFVLSGLDQGLDREVLASCVWMGMEAAGVEMRGTDGVQLTDPQHCLELIRRHIHSFSSGTLPRLVRLGIVDGQN
jgi:SAM-dependent methyltransferase